MKREFIQDINKKFSSKRIIAYLSFVVALILTVIYVKKAGNVDKGLIAMFLSISGGEGILCIKEKFINDK